MLTFNEKYLEAKEKKDGTLLTEVVCMEEMSELIQELSKSLRGDVRIEHIAEEMADVYMCLEHLKRIYRINDPFIQEWIIFKEKRDGFNRKDK